MDKKSACALFELVFLSTMPKKASKKRVKSKVSSVSSFRSQLFLVFSLCLLLFGFLQLGQYLIALKQQLVSKKVIRKTQQITENAKPLRLKDKIVVYPKLQALATHDHPKRIIMPRLGIDMNIVESDVKDGYWKVSEKDANHGMGTAYPGQKGNVVIFAHARIGMFLPLKDVTKNDVIYILTKNKWYTYKVIDIKSVLPDQVDAVEPTKDERLTMFTCTGFADEKRLIVVGKPV